MSQFINIENTDFASVQHECVIEKVGKNGNAWTLLAYLNDGNSQSSHKVVTKLSQSCHEAEERYMLSVEVLVLLLKSLCEPLTAKQMRELCERKDVSYFNRKTIQPMLADGIIMPKITKAKRSPNQMYYLGERGLTLLADLAAIDETVEKRKKE